MRDVLFDDFGVEVSALPEHWIPIAIVGTLDWVFICGWWIFRNTGIYNSDEPYKFVFEYDGYEFDPDRLQMFKEDPARHKFQERLEHPGISGKERTEALPFLREEIFQSWLVGEQGLDEDEAASFVPPQEFMELAMYATFLWVLDTYGRDWIYMQDEILACVYDYQVAYLSTWEPGSPELLDPEKMNATQRPVNSCRYCGNTLWCVIGTEVGGKWQFICNSCTVGLAEAGEVSAKSARVREPKCPHILGKDGSAGSCVATCPHSQMSEERVWDQMEERGSARVELYRDKVRELGMNPRQAAGQTLADLVKHFKRELGDGGGTAPRRLGGEDE